MKWVRFVLFLALIVILATCANTRSDKPPRAKAHKLAFALPDLAGKEISLSDKRFAGKVVLVSLWGTWCPPCVSEIPTFRDLQERLGPEGLEIVAIAFEKENDAGTRVDHLREFSGKNEINYLVLDGGSTSDFSTALPNVENVEGLPVEIFIHRDGTVVHARNGYGFTEEWAQELERFLSSMLRGRSE